MSKELQDLLFMIRQHAAFQELRDFVKPPEPRPFKPSEDADVQFSQFIYRSGQQRQHDAWLSLLTGEPTSDKEKS